SSVFNVVINLPIAIPATASSTTPIAARLRLATSGTTSATGVAPNGEVEDLFINLQAQGIDYGDLPDAAAGTAPGLLGTASPPDYKTRSADGGPSHIMRPGLLFSDPGTVLGNLDPEPDGQPSAMNADGDDTHGESDEIGLFSALSLSTLVLADGIHTIYEHRLTLSHGVINTTGSMAHVSCFLDVNSDGDFADPGEQAPVIDVPGDGSVAAVTPVFTYNIMYQPSVKLAVRSRITTDAGITSGGPASDGEVQDDTLTYSMSLPPGYELTVDYGDLNAARYPTLYASNGARHVITQTLFMGANVPDGEPDANASLAANGDDTNGSDDEDGFNPTAIAAVVNQSVNFPVMVSNATGIAAKLYGFVDWNDDGDLADPGESANIAVPAGAAGLVVMLPWAVPAAASTTAPVAVRLRLSHDAALGPMGYASDGEVEDYLLNVYPGLDFGDLPDPYHTTLLLGPRHVPGASLFLGTNPGDYENDGQPTALANGDDANTTDDEDGLNPATVTANTSFPTVLPIKATNTTAIPARLFVFVDWNADGDFLDVSETNTVIVPPASINVLFNVPFVVPHTASVAPNGVAVRLRLSTAVALGPDGVALDGEVEDYFITAQHFYDFGDLPDSVSGASAGVVTNFSTVSQGDYQTRLADNGARHVIRTDLVLFNDANPGGIHIDPDTDGHPSADATGDDADADDDEELFLSAITRQSATNLTATTIDIDYELYASLAVKNETGVDAYLTGFLDANNDGDFSDFGETKTITVPSAAGFSTQNLTFTPKLTLTKPTTVWTPVMPVRFRFSTQAGLTAAGEASDGEVEDYMVTVSFSVSEWWPKIVNNPSHDFNADIGTPLPLKTSKLPPMFGQANDQTWKIGPATLQGFDPVISTGLLSSIGLGVRTYSVSAQLAPNLLLSHSGLIKIGSLDDFRSFMSQHSITGSAASPDEDSDGDGISNFAEFVFGTDPGTVNQPPRFEPKTVNDTGGNYFTLPYLRRTGGTINGAVYETPDAHYIPQASNDLADWTKPITNVPPPSGLPTPPAGYEWGAVRIPTALSGGGTGFVRLNVLLP
ncbi:MAG: GEVED domain-containing protein, partial [Verrucomicrobia bacterium]|nr:GEVED domain-containing protein [Verrucomicrobiota bacterium]